MKGVQKRSFFGSVFSRIGTESGEILRISPYSVRMLENKDQKKTPQGYDQKRKLFRTGSHQRKNFTLNN